MQRKTIKSVLRIARLGPAKRLTRGIFGPYLEINGNLQDVA